MRALIVLSVFAMLLFSGCLGQRCPDTVEPVCGSDGVTYPNACLAGQAGVQVRSQGACDADACSDSDGGRDLFEAGTASDQRGSISDSCADSLGVEEAVCSGRTAAKETLPCPKGYACASGACVLMPCQDTDGGKEEGSKGSVTTSAGTFADECAGASAVKEYYCDDGEALYEQIACASGFECRMGACEEALCTDSDGGKDVEEKGTIRKAETTQEDSCFSASSVKEYYCEGKMIKSETIPCPANYVCEEGRCKKEVCLDSDGGKDTSKKGTAEYLNRTGTDSCYSSTAVLEYYCLSQTAMDVEKINCGSGKECLDGACRPVECVKETVNLDEQDVRYGIVALDDGDTLTMSVGQAVEVNSKMMLKLHSISGNTTTFRLYMDYEAYLDNDQECSESIDEGDDADNLCGESTGTVEVLAVDDGADTAELSIEDYVVSEYYDVEGEVIDWTDNPVCLDDERSIEYFNAKFYPYLDTSSSGLDLEGRKFKMFDQLAEIIEVTSDTFAFELDGEEYEVEDGDEIEYGDEDYEITLDFGDLGLEGLEAELS